MDIRVRPYRPDDLDDLYRICLQTGNNGLDATAEFGDHRLLGHLHAAPYGVLEPSLAFVAEDAAGVGGYVVGALDTQEFEKRLEADWWPGLRRCYPEPPRQLSEQEWTRDQRVANQIHHPWSTTAEIAGPYPSHLHINLLPRLQSHGIGRRLIETLTGALRERGSRGVHLAVRPANHRAAAFYQHVGFTELPAPEGSGRLFVMDLTK